MQRHIFVDALVLYYYHYAYYMETLVNAVKKELFVCHSQAPFPG